VAFTCDQQGNNKMHTVTFYSYKGGTGRSMAVVNVATELIKAGFTVLIVDFDLEAPGLDTFNLTVPKKPTKGIVDFVIEYLETNEPPDISEFVYRCTIPKATGQLWVMPAGASNDQYDTRFKSIDWRELYENRDGYLLFEDAKAQWDQLLKPDYVLIDSRTGHTDVSGICTRQLPDSVLLFFMPTEQNRRGLETVVRQIRRESDTNRRERIKLHFIMSNVPDLDDEKSILAERVVRLKESLKFEEFSATIHTYPSLSLLAQTVFTLDRPLTKLAKEYGLLTRVIRRDNPEDREGSLEFLEEMAPPVRARHLQAGEIEQRIQGILTKHNDDPELLTRLAVVRRRQRRFDEALTALERAGELGASSAEFYLLKAELLIISRNLTAAIDAIRHLLNTSDATYLEVSAAARLLLQRIPESLHEIVQTPAFKRLDVDGQYQVATELFDSRQGMAVAATILGNLRDKPEISPQLIHQISVNFCFVPYSPRKVF
jgi:MinD-like ATPase involved in chromosome partitioning or flagellar assembly